MKTSTKSAALFFVLLAFGLQTKIAFSQTGGYAGA